MLPLTATGGTTLFKPEHMALMAERDLALAAYAREILAQSREIIAASEATIYIRPLEPEPGSVEDLRASFIGPRNIG